MHRLKQTLSEPLLHFLILGVGLFLAFDALNPAIEQDDPNRINVSRESLLTYLQYQAKSFDNERYHQLLDALPTEELQRLIDRYVRDETLYREAKALQLDKNDRVARQRLIQQMRYLTQSLASTDTELTDKQLQAFYQKQQTRYIEPARSTFTHVFYSTEYRDPESARTLALKKRQQLNQEKIPFHQAPGHGERFLYHRNYVNKEADVIASHFGVVMQKLVFALPADDQRWRGPYQSEYGYHLVLVTQQTDSYTPELNDVKQRVAQDLLLQRQRDDLEQAIQLMVKRYQIDIADDLAKTQSANNTAAVEDAG